VPSRSSGSVVGTSSRAHGCASALAYLAYPWIAWSAVDTFHPVTLAIPLFLLCIWFLERTASYRSRSLCDRQL
jgi:uncharacterized membrane protein